MKVGHTCSEQHRRNVGEGVRKAWERRYREGFKPKGPKGQLSEIAKLLKVSPTAQYNVAYYVRLLHEKYIESCCRIREVTAKYKLGLGGEDILTLLIDDYERLKGNHA